MVTEMVGCRLTPEYIKKIDVLVENGDFTSRGEFVKYAIRQTLKRYEGRSPPLGMSKGVRGELGIEVPLWLASLPGEVGILMSLPPD